MTVFEKNGEVWCFVHIPKNCGKYIRGQIRKKHKIINSMWGIDLKTTKLLGFKSFTDRMHVPVDIYSDIFEPMYNIKKYIVYTRNPYHRMISAFMFRHYGRRPEYKKIPEVNSDISAKFKAFVKNIINHTNVDEYPERPGKYNEFGVHYMSQYSFVQNSDKDCIILNIEYNKKHSDNISLIKYISHNLINLS